MGKIERIKDFYFEHKFLIDCLILSVLFFANTFIPNFTYISFSFLFFLVLTTNLKYTLSYLFFSGAFCQIDSTKSIVLYAICFVIFLIKFIYVKFFIEKHKLNNKLIFFLVVFLLILIFCKFDYSIPFYKTFILTFLVYFILFILYLILNFSQDLNLKINLRILCYGLIMSTIFAYSCNILFPGLRKIGFDGELFRFMALYTNPNTLAMVCELALAILAYYIASHKYNRKDVITFIIISLIGILTASKTYLVLLFIILICLFIFNIKNISKYELVFILLGLIICVIFTIVKFDIILSMIKRFIAIDVSGMGANQFLNILTTTRYELWQGYWGYLIENPLSLFIGRGMGASKIGTNSGHNMYLNIIYQMGILGFVLLTTVVIFIIMDSKKKNKIKFNKAIIIPILILALLCCIEDLFIFVM